MKKKLSLLLCLAAMALAMTACKTDPTTVDYYGTTYDELKTAAEEKTAAFSEMSADELDAFIAENADNEEAELDVKLAENVKTAIDGVGNYQGLGELSVDKANGTVTVEQDVDFSDRDISVTYVYEYDYQEEALAMQDVTADKIYSLGEKMSKAALNTLMGMGTVFVVLILISLIIYCFRFIPNPEAAKKKKAAEEAKTAVETATAEEESAVLTDDLELVAVISAAIAASTGTSTDSFVVRSINRR